MWFEGVDSKFLQKCDSVIDSDLIAFGQFCEVVIRPKVGHPFLCLPELRRIPHWKKLTGTLVARDSGNTVSRVYGPAVHSYLIKSYEIMFQISKIDHMCYEID